MLLLPGVVHWKQHHFLSWVYYMSTDLLALSKHHQIQDSGKKVFLFFKCKSCQWWLRQRIEVWFIYSHARWYSRNYLHSFFCCKNFHLSRYHFFVMPYPVVTRILTPFEKLPIVQWARLKGGRSDTREMQAKGRLLWYWNRGGGSVHSVMPEIVDSTNVLTLGGCLSVL